MDLSSLYRRVGSRLAAWSVASVVVGTALAWAAGPFWRGVGIQALAWGAIDLVLALMALARAARLRQRDPDEVFELRQTLRLRRLLIINGRLDLLYIAAGTIIAFLWSGDPFWAGSGVGIVIQGLFLLWFDFAHASALPKQPPPWYDERL